ncbi:MAG: hypothetical protein AAB649_00945 [Patescibacteria group bacterium]
MKKTSVFTTAQSAKTPPLNGEKLAKGEPDIIAVTASSVLV